MKSILLPSLAIAGLATSAFAEKLPFDVPTGSMVDIKTVYAVDVFKNSMSTVNLSVDTGNVLQADIIFASDTNQYPNPAGVGSYIQGYTANVGILIPMNSAWGIRNLSKFDSLTFDWATNGPIRDQLTVSFGSPQYNDTLSNAGAVYEASKKRTTELDSVVKSHLASPTGHDWATLAYRRADFMKPTWINDALTGFPSRWTEPMATFPTFDSVLANVKNIQIAPKTSYQQPGWNFSTNVACPTCAVAYLPIPVLTIRLRNINIWLSGEERPMKLGIGNGLEIGVRDAAKGSRWLGLSWKQGKLNLEHASQWSKVQILSLDGKAIASFAASSAMPLDLANGTYFASLVDAKGQVATQSFQVVR